VNSTGSSIEEEAKERLKNEREKGQQMKSIKNTKQPRILRGKRSIPQREMMQQLMFSNAMTVNLRHFIPS
jgi:hypothetical protein